MPFTLPSGLRLANPATRYVTILTMDDGSHRQSVPLERYEDADSIGRLSLLDADVLSFTVEALPAPAGAA